MAKKTVKKQSRAKKETIIFQHRSSFPLRNPVEYFLVTLLLVLTASLATFLYVRHMYESASVLGTLAHLQNSQEKNTHSSIELPEIQQAISEEKEAIQSQENPAVILHGPRDKKEVALTFDAEMTDWMKSTLLAGKVKSSYDKSIINTLISTDTKATLFLTGMWIELYPKEAKSFALNPLFELGSHSYADTSYDGTCYGLKQIPDSQDIEQLGVTQKLLSELTGKENKLFRFPGGCFSQKDIDIVHEAGMIIVHWDVAGGDGFNNDANTIVKNVLGSVQNGSIILFHMNGAPTAPKTAEALPLIINALKQKGYSFVKVSELLHLSS